MSFLRPGDRVLFTGDSVTDAGRDRSDPASLGHGYALIAASLAGARHPELGLEFRNRGVGGDTSASLRDRWESDTIALAPSVVSILVGVNDTWRWFDSGDRISAEEFEDNLRAILDSTVDRLEARIVLVEPFLLAVSPGQHAWRDDLDPRIHAVRRLATEYRARLVPADGILAAAAVRSSAPSLAHDGVHPTPAGHGLLAEAWLAAVDL